MVWHCLRVPGKNGEYRPIPGAWGHYSEDFPIWRMTYEIGMHFREVFEHYSNWKVQRLFNLKKDEEIDSSDSYPSSAHRAIMSSPPLRLSVDGEAVTLVGSKKRRRIFPTPRLDVASMLDARIQYSIISFMIIIIGSYRSESRFLLSWDSAGFLSPQKN